MESVGYNDGWELENAVDFFIHYHCLYFGSGRSCSRPFHICTSIRDEKWEMASLDEYVVNLVFRGLNRRSSRHQMYPFVRETGT